MLLSVIIPTCNRHDFLGKCLNLLAPGFQTLSSDQYHVVVTDDGKQAPARAMMAEKYAWAQWVEGPLKGPASNRNNGVKYARANWIVFLDDDCLPANDILATYQTYILNNPDIEVLEGKIERCQNRKSILEYAPCNYNGGNLWSCNFAIQRAAFDEVGGFDENFRFAHLEDTDLKKRIDATGRKILFANEAIVLHPWRKLNGNSMGRNEEMSVYFSSKYGHNATFVNYLKRITGHHLHMLKRTLFSAEIFTAIKITSQHLGVVLFNFHKWKKKYPIALSAEITNKQTQEKGADQ